MMKPAKPVSVVTVDKFSFGNLEGILKGHIELLIDQLRKIAGHLELELDFSEEDISFVDSGQIHGRRAEVDQADELVADFAWLALSCGSISLRDTDN